MVLTGHSFSPKLELKDISDLTNRQRAWAAQEMHFNELFGGGPYVCENIGQNEIEESVSCFDI